jgi:hypothetical protein
MARLEYYVLNDADLSFKDILKRSLSGEPLLDKKELEEWEESRRKHAAADKGDEEKKTTTTKSKSKKKKSRKGGGRGRIDNGESEHEEENGEEEEPMEEGEEDEEVAATLSRPAAVEKPSAAEKAKAVERAAILAPQLNLQQIEAAIAKGGGAGGYDQDMINELMAQTYAASVRWPRDKVLHVRLRHIVACLEEEGGRWPVPPHSLLLEQTGDSGTATPEPAAAGANGNSHGIARDTSTPLSEVWFLHSLLEKLLCTLCWISEE